MPPARKPAPSSKRVAKSDTTPVDEKLFREVFKVVFDTCPRASVGEIYKALQETEPPFDEKKAILALQEEVTENINALRYRSTMDVEKPPTNEDLMDMFGVGDGIKPRDRATGDLSGGARSRPVATTNGNIPSRRWSPNQDIYTPSKRSTQQTDSRLKHQQWHSPSIPTNSPFRPIVIPDEGEEEDEVFGNETNPRAILNNSSHQILPSVRPPPLDVASPRSEGSARRTRQKIKLVSGINDSGDTVDPSFFHPPKRARKSFSNSSPSTAPSQQASIKQFCSMQPVSPTQRTGIQNLRTGRQHPELISTSASSVADSPSPAQSPPLRADIDPGIDGILHPPTDTESQQESKVKHKPALRGKQRLEPPRLLPSTVDSFFVSAPAQIPASSVSRIHSYEPSPPPSDTVEAGNSPPFPFKRTKRNGCVGAVGQQDKGREPSPDLSSQFISVNGDEESLDEMGEKEKEEEEEEVQVEEEKENETHEHEQIRDAGVAKRKKRHAGPIDTDQATPVKGAGKKQVKKGSKGKAMIKDYFSVHQKQDGRGQHGKGNNVHGNGSDEDVYVLGTDVSTPRTATLRRRTRSSTGGGDAGGGVRGGVGVAGAGTRKGKRGRG